MNSHDEIRQRRKRALFVAGSFIAAGCLAILAIMAFSRFTGKTPYSPPDTRRSADEIRLLSAKHIQDANKKAAEEIERHAEEFSQFILDRKTRSRAFAKDITSLTGKWRTVKPYLPGTDPDGHKKYIAEVFSKDIFTANELGAALNRTIDGSVRDMEGIQNDLAVELRHEILMEHIEQHNIPIIQEEFRESVNQMLKASQWDAKKDVGNLAVSELVSFVTIQVFIRLGVSAGILTVAAADSWWTFGASIVIGIIADAVWTWIDDPIGDIEKQMNSALDKMAADGKAAIVTEMTKVLNEKTTIWSQATEQMIKEHQ